MECKFLKFISFLYKVNCTPSRKEIKDLGYKTHKSTCTYLAFLYEPNGTYSSLIVQLEAEIIEVPTLQVTV